MIYYLTATGNGISRDGTLPSGAVACTQAQYNSAANWTVNGGQIVAIPPPALTPAQLATAALSAGLAVSSTSTPALNGTYIVAPGVPFGQGDLATEAQFVSTFGEFTNGTTTIEWPLLTEGAVTFPNTAAFLSVAKVIAQYVATLKAIIASNAGILPAPAATIP